MVEAADGTLAAGAINRDSALPAGGSRKNAMSGLHAGGRGITCFFLPHEIPLLALPASAGRHQKCPLIGLERKTFAKRRETGKE